MQSDWEHTFNISTQLTWPRRKWKAYAVRTSVRSGAIRIEYPGTVKFSAKAETKEQALQAVQKKIDDYAQTLTEKHTKAKEQNNHRYTIKTPGL